MTATAELAIETIATPSHAQLSLKVNASRPRTADERAEVERAKKKKKRATHRVALRRSHTKG
jgi:hypothetical protein